MREISFIFLRLGALGFGGPIAIMAMMEEELCGRRAWVTPARFNEIYALCKVLPGPIGTQMAIFLGYHRAGRIGGLVAGLSFIFPAFALVLALSWIYSRYGLVQRAQLPMLGMQAAALGVILSSSWQLGRTYWRWLGAWLIVAVSTVIVMLRPQLEPGLIFGFGLVGVLFSRRFPPANGEAVTKSAKGAWGFAFLAGALELWALPERAWAAIETQASGTLVALFWTCFKSGLFVFGSGLAIVPLLEHEMVTRQGWLTHAQFMDGLVIGQITPGPVTITTTFVGFQMAGWVGAVVGTVGIFLPAFLIVLFVLPLFWKRISGTPTVTAFARFAIPAVIGGILGTTVRLAEVAVRSAQTLTGESWSIAVVFGLATVAAFSRRVPAWALIPLGGVSFQIIDSMSHI